jgi:hypothetical protein
MFAVRAVSSERRIPELKCLKVDTLWSNPVGVGSDVAWARLYGGPLLPT